jgi:hypothetical protein
VREPYPLLLEVIQAVVGEHKPAPLPALHPPALLGEVSLVVGLREHANGAVQLDLIADDAVVQTLEHIRGQVATVVDPPVVGDPSLLGHLLLHRGVVSIGVEHDDRKRQDVGSVCAQGVSMESQAATARGDQGKGVPSWVKEVGLFAQ